MRALRVAAGTTMRPRDGAPSAVRPGPRSGLADTDSVRTPVRRPVRVGQESVRGGVCDDGVAGQLGVCRAATADAGVSLVVRHRRHDRGRAIFGRCGGGRRQWAAGLCATNSPSPAAPRRDAELAHRGYAPQAKAALPTTGASGSAARTRGGSDSDSSHRRPTTRAGDSGSDALTVHSGLPRVNGDTARSAWNKRPFTCLVCVVSRSSGTARGRVTRFSRRRSPRADSGWGGHGGPCGVR